MIFKHQLFLLIYLLTHFFFLECLGQEDDLNRLKGELQRSREDTSRVHVLLKLCDAVSNSDEKLYYSKRAISLSSQLGYQKGSALAHIKQAEALRARDIHDEAKASLTVAHNYFRSYKEHSGYVHVLLNLAKCYDAENEFDSAFSYYDSTIHYSSIYKHVDVEAEAYYYSGGLSNAIGKNIVAEKSMLKSFEHYDSLDQIENLWYVLNGMGVVYDDMGKYPKALNNYMQALEIVEEIKEIEGQIMLLNNIASLYYQIGKLDESLKFYDQALEKTVGRIDDEHRWYLLGNKAQIHAEMGDTVGALVNFRKALELSQEVEDECEQVYILDGIGIIMSEKDELDSAKSCFSKAASLAEECNNQLVLTTVLRELGEVYAKEANLTKSEKLFIQSLSLSEEYHFPKEKEKVCLQLYLLNKRLRRNNRALDYFEMYSSTRDSLFGNETNMALARISSEYEFKKELQRMEYSRRADELRLQAELEREESNKNVLLLVLILTVLLAATLVRSYFLLQSHNKRLEVLNEEKNTLMGVVAHDLRSPLNNIKGLIALMKSDPKFKKNVAEGDQYFQLLSDTTNHMTEMIDKALDINAIEEMKLNLNLQKYDLGKLLKGVSENFAFMATKKNIQIHDRFELNRFFADVDKNYIIQVFDNLLSNAIKFSEPDKNIYLNIALEDKYVVVSVTDEGPGLSEEDRSKLFTKFQKLGAKPTGDEQSIGLGLSIVKKFVNAMNGSIDCESQLGQGSTFIVRFLSAQ